LTVTHDGKWEERYREEKLREIFKPLKTDVNNPASAVSSYTKSASVAVVTAVRRGIGSIQCDAKKINVCSKTAGSPA